MARFTVDTHLFRELGELLVGRDSTALVELIKNAYDADATAVTVYGEGLDDARCGFIRIRDNGIGMTGSEFEDGFLRVASRAKDQGTRLSLKHGRRYTGMKGIGRLAAHKLARVIEISSVPWDAKTGGMRENVLARIDWDVVEQCETLDQIEGTNAIKLEKEIVSPRSEHGTEIVLSRLRRRWTPAERGRFLAEVQTFEPPEPLVSPLPQNIVDVPLLFRQPVVRDSSSSDPLTFR